MALWTMDDEILRIEPYKNMQKIKALINIVPKIVGTLFILGASVDLFFRLKEPKSINFLWYMLMDFDQIF